MLSVALAAALTLQAQQASDCLRALSGGPSATAAEVCRAEELMSQARASTERTPARRRTLTQARDHLRRAVVLSSQGDVKQRALERLVELHDPDHLDDPGEMEAALRELIVMRPEDMKPVERLMKLLEARKLVAV